MFRISEYPNIRKSIFIFFLAKTPSREGLIFIRINVPNIRISEYPKINFYFFSRKDAKSRRFNFYSNQCSEYPNIRTSENLYINSSFSYIYHYNTLLLASFSPIFCATKKEVGMFCKFFQEDLLFYAPFLSIDLLFCFGRAYSKRSINFGKA